MHFVASALRHKNKHRGKRRKKRVEGEDHERGGDSGEKAVSDGGDGDATMVAEEQKRIRKKKSG